MKGEEARRILKEAYPSEYTDVQESWGSYGEHYYTVQCANVRVSGVTELEEAVAYVRCEVRLREIQREEVRAAARAKEAAAE